MPLHHDRRAIEIRNGAGKLAAHGSCACWAENTTPSGTAIVFVHGFRGKAVDTWRQFEFLLPEDPNCENTDIVFFGHDGGKTLVYPNAIRLQEFLSDLVRNPSPLWPAWLKRDAGFRYTKIVLVGHSLGAVLARRAMLIAHEHLGAADPRGDWVRLVKPVFFAPAYHGSDIPQLVQEAVLGFSVPGLSTVIPLAFLGYRALADLKSTSDVLKHLRSDTEAALPTGRYLAASRVVLAANDRVVLYDKYPGEPIQPDKRDKGHIDVCKPGPVYADPVAIVLDTLLGSTPVAEGT